MIEAENLSKSYGDKFAVRNLSFKVEPGKVTGFLGPNGAGKSTTMRLILGLARPDSGRAVIAGKTYREFRRPLCVVGALLEAKAWHPGRSVYNHLRWLAQTQRLPRSRIDEVVRLAGLTEVAHKRPAGFSLGMSQRLSIAAAMLGDPAVLVLDEPVNGLDPAGVRWIRELMQQLAAEGRTVLVSSHLVNEMAVTADQLIVIGKGEMLANCSTAEFVARGAAQSVLARSPDAARLAELLADEGGRILRLPDGAMTITGLSAARIAEVATEARLIVHELTPQLASLEDAFMDLTRDSVEFDGELPAKKNVAAKLESGKA